MIGEFLSTVFLWSSLIENGAVAQSDERRAGFEPRDGLWRNLTIRNIEIDSRLGVVTHTPIELVPTVYRDIGPLCEMCPECFVCVSNIKYPARPMRLLYTDPDLLLIHSAKAQSMKEGFEIFFSEGFKDRAIWRAGLKPVRVWVQDCTLVVSLLTGAFPVCNCSPAPDPYQLLIGGFSNFFARSHFHNLNRLCGRRSREDSCEISIAPGINTLWYNKANQTRDLIQRKVGVSPDSRLTTPGFSLTLHWERVTHYNPDNASDFTAEVFFALRRSELAKVIRDMARHNRGIPELVDVERFLIDKVNNTIKPYCYQIGKKNQTAPTFDNFFRIVETR